MKGVEYPAYPKKRISEITSGYMMQETGQPDRKPELNINIIGASETVYERILQVVNEFRRPGEDRNGEGIQFCAEYTEYFPKEETETVKSPGR